MSVEQKRGCGFRKIGGLYLVGGGIGIPCDRLPFEVGTCSCCGQGIKQAMGWTWTDVGKFFRGPHVLPISAGSIAPPEKLWPCYCNNCPLCHAPETLGRAGLIWIGEKFYKFPSHFVKEGISMGFSRRIKAIPHGFKIGETWVMLAHSKTVFDWTESADHARMTIYKPGIFYAWLPQRIEKIMKESTRGTEEIADLEKRGITPVFVPDDDTDHQGNVHDDHDREDREKREEPAE